LELPSLIFLSIVAGRLQKVDKVIVSRNEERKIGRILYVDVHVRVSTANGRLAERFESRLPASLVLQ
jgi:hypothetical protein